MTRFGLIFCAASVLSLGACSNTHTEHEVMLTHHYGVAEQTLTPLAQNIDPAPRCETFLANMALAEKKTASTYPIHAL